MKRIYIQFLLILLVSTFNIDLQAQRLNIPEKSTIGDEFLIAPDGTYSELRPDLSGNCGCEISDLSFNWRGSFEAAIANENLIRLARKRTLKKWYTNQINKVVKPAIEYKLNLKFPTYSEAKTALFKYSERGNISRNLPVTKRNLEKKVSVNQSKQRRYLKDLKILSIREAEISSGNITSPEFGYYKVNGIDLRNIKTISDLNKTKKIVNSQFESNHIELFKNNLIYEKAKSLNYWSIEKEVINKKHNYYNNFNEWDRLNLMQLLVHYEQYKQLSNCMVCLHPESFTKFKGLDISTAEFITNYAIKNREDGISVFYKDYWKEILYKEYGEKTIYKYNPSLFMQHFIVLTSAAQKEHKKRKKEELDKLLNSTSTADFAITNFIEELKITDTKQKEWLYKHKTAADKLIKFIDNNKVNNKVTDKAKTFAVEVSKALANDTNLDIRPYLKNITATPSGTSHQNYDPNDPILGNQILLDIVNNAIDGFGNLILLYLEYKSNNANEGKVLRYLMPKMGLEISDDIPDETLGELFSLRKRDRSLVIEYQNNTIKGLLIEVTVSTLDVVALISPSKGGGAYLLASGGHRVTAASLSKLLNSLKSRIYTLRGDMIGKTIGHTFKTHGSHLTEMCKLRAINGNKHVGQWLDDAAAESFIARHLNQLKKGTIDVPIPSNIQNIGRVFRKRDGAIITPTHIRLVPSGSGVKTAYPINSSLTDLRTIGVYIP